MKTFLFQGDSITDASRDDEEKVNFGLGCGYAFFLASEFEKNNKGKIKFINDYSLYFEELTEGCFNLKKFVRISNLWQRLLRSQNRLKTTNCLSLSSPEK